MYKKNYFFMFGLCLFVQMNLLASSNQEQVLDENKLLKQAELAVKLGSAEQITLTFDELDRLSPGIKASLCKLRANALALENQKQLEGAKKAAFVAFLAVLTMVFVQWCKN